MHTTYIKVLFFQLGRLKIKSAFRLTRSDNKCYPNVCTNILLNENFLSIFIFLFTRVTKAFVFSAFFGQMNFRPL